MPYGRTSNQRHHCTTRVLRGTTQQRNTCSCARTWYCVSVVSYCRTSSPLLPHSVTVSKLSSASTALPEDTDSRVQSSSCSRREGGHLKRVQRVGCCACRSRGGVSRPGQPRPEPQPQPQPAQPGASAQPQANALASGQFRCMPSPPVISLSKSFTRRRMPAATCSWPPEGEGRGRLGGVMKCSNAAPAAADSCIHTRPTAQPTRVSTTVNAA